MKTIFIAAMLFVATGFAGFAQDETYEDEPQTIFSTGSKVTGWFVEFSNSYTSLNGEYTNMPGFAGGVVMNRNFSIGLIGKSLSWYPTYLKYDNVLDEPVYLEGGYGGLYLVASPIEKKVLHITFPLVIGAGGAAYVSQEQYPDIDDFEDMDDLYDYDHCTLSSSPYFIVEPGANVELNVTGFMKLYAGYSYRWLMGLNLENTASTALNGSSFNFGVKFGKF
jgi:hypothetical protein